MSENTPVNDQPTPETAEDVGGENTPTTPSKPDLASTTKQRGRTFRWAWLPPLLLLIVLRALFIHSDPTDYPLDRNIGMAMTFRAVLGERTDGGTALPAKKSLLARRAEAPEFSFVRVWAVSLAKMGLDPIVAARLLALIASILTGVGLAMLGQRLGPPLVGTLALWIYGLLPLSVLMGRVIIPDTFMVAAVVWSLVAAGAGMKTAPARHSLWPSVAMTLALIVASLAKLPAVFFAPVAAVALMQWLGWRRWSAWAGVATAALVTYLAVCIWYRLAPWAPWVGLRRISENTNNLMAAIGLLSEPPIGRVWFSRIIMALSLPGLLLAAIGWFLLQRRTGQRLWLNLWILLALIFVAVTMNTNSYWVYPLTPVGCLLSALALAELRKVGWALAIPLLLPVAFLWIDPSTRQVADYLKTQPGYNHISVATDILPDDSNVLFLGKAPQDLEYFSSCKGQTPLSPDLTTLRPRLVGRTFSHALTNQMQGEGIERYLFDHWPVIDTKPLDFVLFANPSGQSLGEAVNEASIGDDERLDLNLDGVLRIIAAQALKDEARPGGPAGFVVTFEKGPAYTDMPPLTVAFVHEQTGEEMPVAPVRGGASFMLAMLPLLQTPDFDSGPVEQITYGFYLPRQMPTGDYRLKFSLLADRQRTLVRGESVLTAPLLKVDRPLRMDKAPMEINPADCLRLNPSRVTRLTPGGNTVVFARIASDSSLWMCPTLPPGDYQLRVTGRGNPVGMGEDRWPVLRVTQPGRADEIEMPFDSRNDQSVTRPFKFYGSEDFLRLSIQNPLVEPPVRSNWPLYMDDVAGGNRSVEIDRIEILPGK